MFYTTKQNKTTILNEIVQHKDINGNTVSISQIIPANEQMLMQRMFMLRDEIKTKQEELNQILQMIDAFKTEKTLDNVKAELNIEK